MDNDLQKKMDELKEMGRELLEKELDLFFQQFPEITEFSWTQYTPYFNDGETCYFGVHTYDIFYDMYEETESVYYKAEKELEKVFSKLDTIFYNWLFGDHVEVTAKFVNNSVEFEVEEYRGHD